MPSALTQVIAARVPNHEAERLRVLASAYGLTVSDLVKAALAVNAPPAAAESPEASGR